MCTKEDQDKYDDMIRKFELNILKTQKIAYQESQENLVKPQKEFVKSACPKKDHYLKTEAGARVLMNDAKILIDEFFRILL